MKETTVHRAEAQLAERSAVRIRKDRFAAELCRNPLQPRRDLVECLVPRNALESVWWHRLCGSDIPVRASVERQLLPNRTIKPLGPHPPHRVQHSIRRIYPIQILRHFGAQKPPRDRMRRVALYLDRLAIVHRDQDSARIRAI